MNPKPNPFLWLLSGFASCAVLLTGILWWRGGGNPFLKPTADVPPSLAGTAPIQPSAVPAAAGGAPPAPAASSVPAAPPAVPTRTVPEAVKQALASSTPSALATFAALAGEGTIPRADLIEAAYQWGTLHLPADPSKADAPFEEVVKLLKNSTKPEERGFAAVALAGSGRSTEALDAIQKAAKALAPEAPERSMMEEALKLANQVPGEAAEREKAVMKATAPEVAAAPDPAPAKVKKEEETGETVKRPVLPHETPEEAAKIARLLKEATDSPEMEGVSLYVSPAAIAPPSISVVPLPSSGGSRQTKILPAR